MRVGMLLTSGSIKLTETWVCMYTSLGKLYTSLNKYVVDMFTTDQQTLKNAQSEIEESASPKKGELTAALAQVVTLTAMLSRHVSVYSTWDPPSIIKSLLNLQTFKTPLIVLCKDWKFLKRPPVQTVMLIFF